MMVSPMQAQIPRRLPSGPGAAGAPAAGAGAGFCGGSVSIGGSLGRAVGRRCTGSLPGSADTPRPSHLADAPGVLYPHGVTVLGGALAVPCTRNPLPRGTIPTRGACPKGSGPCNATLMVRSHSVGDREPGQVRKEAALSGSAYAQWGYLAGVGGTGTAFVACFDGGCTVTSAPAPPALQGR